MDYKVYSLLKDAAALNNINLLKECLGKQAVDTEDITIREFAEVLAYACRYGGIQSVKTLVELKKCMDNTQVTADPVYRPFHCNPANYTSMLLDYCPWGAYFSYSQYLSWYRCGINQQVVQLLPKQERLEILSYLLSNKEIISFEPGEVLCYAILADDTEIVDMLRASGVVLSPVAQKELFECKNSYFWRRLCNILNCPEIFFEKFFDILENLCLGFDKRIRCSTTFFDIHNYLYQNVELMKRALNLFKHSDLNKLQIMRKCISENSVEFLKLFESIGWLERVQSLDSLIEYAKAQNLTEVLAWLLDYKNRTVDFDAERIKTEKKAERELAAAPDSAYAMSKIWGNKKLDDGTVQIISLKAPMTDVVVPKQIGKRLITRIGGNAFTRYKQGRSGDQVTLIVIPEGVTVLESRAMANLRSLSSVSLPSTLKTIGSDCFYLCESLTSITIPSNVETIGVNAFFGCSKLKEVVLSEGLKHIARDAFRSCTALRKISIPDSVEYISNDFDVENRVWIVGVGSYAHDYCLAHDIRFELRWEKI